MRIVEGNMTAKKMMPRRRFGTGLNIPVVPCGTQAIGDAFRNHSLEEAFDIMKHCVEVGINHFDTSRCYSGSLPRLGEGIKQGVLKREEVIITCRVCCHGESVDYSADATMRWIEEDMKTLGIDYTDGVFIHDPREITPVLSAGGTVDGLLRLKEQGVIGGIGLGCRPMEYHTAALETGKVDMLLCFRESYNLLYQEAAKEVLPMADDLDVGVLNGFSIMRGILTGEDVDRAAERGRWSKNVEDIRRAREIRKWCNENNVNMLALALQFCLREERIHGNPIALTTIREIDAAVEAMTETLPEEVWREYEEKQRRTGRKRQDNAE